MSPMKLVIAICVITVFGCVPSLAKDGTEVSKVIFVGDVLLTEDVPNTVCAEMNRQIKVNIRIDRWISEDKHPRINELISCYHSSFDPYTDISIADGEFKKEYKRIFFVRKNASLWQEITSFPVLEDKAGKQAFCPWPKNAINNLGLSMRQIDFGGRYTISLKNQPSNIRDYYAGHYCYELKGDNAVLVRGIYIEDVVPRKN